MKERLSLEPEAEIIESIGITPYIFADGSERLVIEINNHRYSTYDKKVLDYVLRRKKLRKYGGEKNSQCQR